jgi:hypothetical protein
MIYMYVERKMNIEQTHHKTILFFNKFGNAMKKSLDEFARFREPAALGKSDVSRFLEGGHENSFRDLS